MSSARAKAATRKANQHADKVYGLLELERNYSATLKALVTSSAANIERLTAENAAKDETIAKLRAKVEELQDRIDSLFPDPKV